MKITTKGPLFNNPSNAVTQVVRKSLDSTASTLNKTYIQNSPVRTGNFKRNWKVSGTYNINTKSASIDINNNVDYAGYVYRKNARLRGATDKIDERLAETLNSNIEKALG